MQLHSRFHIDNKLIKQLLKIISNKYKIINNKKKRNVVTLKINNLGEIIKNNKQYTICKASLDAAQKLYRSITL